MLEPHKLKQYDIIIAGAGPVGAHLAYLLSKKGLSVLVLEKKRAPGKSACSGLISLRLKKLIPLDNSFVEHLIYGATFHSKNTYLTVEKKKPVAYVINRVLFDRHMIMLAEKTGAKIVLGEPFESYSIKENRIVVNEKYRAEMLVGADGAASAVRRLSGLKGKLCLINGIISIFSEPSIYRTVDVFYGKSIAPGFFAWRIPRGKSIEYGLASNKNHIAYFEKFLKQHNRMLGKYYTHPIVFGQTETVGDRVILVGDAALQVKPFSGGGVIYGLMCAKIADKAITNAFKKDDFSKAFFEKNYDGLWKEKLMEPIKNGKLVREMLNSLDDEELDAFFELAAKRKDDIGSFGDMDFL
ncbi:MAG: NAD(P)/FAD-dependent oxidoreductase [Nanoarchaeota archaeon]|nr:NAD(P)/FAD-dependent oxidoreductase [Nanoarchaeota archaeon]MBU4451887.1 NAD(P)/FAD-dependent oxidoreductase [Nanoarchaeota archaeon]MCG2724170.1 NAD(P)/FAD-dependent oxidoreductase [archaeon]